jgi:cellulose synthase/poly-beta-1,6-N-acetylglucosamine synthase-like glycosyltransferase
VIVLEVIFWTAVALLVYTQLVYPGLAALLARMRRPFRPGRRPDRAPLVSLIIAAYAEEGVIAQKVANALALDYPRGMLEVIVCCDGSPDATAQVAREAGAHKILELPRGGKHRAQDAGVEAATGELFAFSDANTMWAPDALRTLVRRFEDERVGYACGRVDFVNDQGTNQEGLYWRYEMWLRANESRLRSVTAGNGAIYAVRRQAYLFADELEGGHDLSLPFNLVKRKWRAVYEPDARAVEKMVPTNEGEFRRKRRMMTQAWPIILHGGLASPRGYGLLYSWMILSHRILRYATPFLHLVALISCALLATGSTFYLALLCLQGALLLGALMGRWIKARVLLVVRYYVLTTGALALGLWDHLRHGTPTGWSPPEGTR